MALIRGTKGFCPCPICLVPADKQSDLSESYPLRTAEDTMAIVDRANEASTATSRDDILKTYSLRNVPVCVH
jgi:hypothetical protein